jgi:hypothetical protein
VVITWARVRVENIVKSAAKSNCADRVRESIWNLC